MTQAEIQTTPQRTVQQRCFVLKVICPRCQRKSDISHISLPSITLSGIPELSVLHPTSNPIELEGALLMDVEGYSGPTAINSSPARSRLSGWWNLPTTAVCHTVQEGQQTNASFMCLVYCFAYSPKGCESKELWGQKEDISAPQTFIPLSRWLECNIDIFIHSSAIALIHTRFMVPAATPSWHLAGIEAGWTMDRFFVNYKV